MDDAGQRREPRDGRERGPVWHERERGQRDRRCHRAREQHGALAPLVREPADEGGQAREAQGEDPAATPPSA